MLLVVIIAAVNAALPTSADQLDILETTRLRVSRWGSAYGGWFFDRHRLVSQSIVYSIGLGTDISFDLMLIKILRCHVHGFDNTPASTRYLQRQQLPKRFHWHRYLLGVSDQNLTLQLPVGHGASYAVDGVGSARGFKQNTSHTARALQLRSMMTRLNHSRIDLLKIDIEAFEFHVFNAMLLDSTDQRPPVTRLPACQLLLEFHSRLNPRGYQAKADVLLELQSLGFTLLHNTVRASGADDALLMNPRFCARR